MRKIWSPLQHSSFWPGFWPGHYCITHQLTFGTMVKDIVLEALGIYGRKVCSCASYRHLQDLGANESLESNLLVDRVSTLTTGLAC